MMREVLQRLGAQSLVKDYFTGVIMLLKDQARVGDVVEIGGKSGLLRATFPAAHNSSGT